MTLFKQMWALPVKFGPRYFTELRTVMYAIINHYEHFGVVCAYTNLFFQTLCAAHEGYAGQADLQQTLRLVGLFFVDNPYTPTPVTKQDLFFHNTTIFQLSYLGDMWKNRQPNWWKTT